MNNSKFNLDEFARQERLAYYKTWRAANRDKVRKHNQNYWKKRALKRLESEQKDGAL